MASETQGPVSTWRQMVADHLAYRGLSLAAAAAEIGVTKGVVEYLLGGGTPHDDNRAIIDAWMARERDRMGGVALQIARAYWAGRIDQIAASMATTLADQHALADTVRDRPVYGTVPAIVATVAATLTAAAASKAAGQAATRGAAVRRRTGTG